MANCNLEGDIFMILDVVKMLNIEMLVGHNIILRFGKLKINTQTLLEL